ncbi:MAG: hypothetical protein AAFY03_12005, partial [Pseudomonadota bacterium]
KKEMSFNFDRDGFLKKAEAKAQARTLERANDLAKTIRCAEHGRSPSVIFEDGKLRIEGCCGTPQELEAESMGFEA